MRISKDHLYLFVSVQLHICKEIDETYKSEKLAKGIIGVQDDIEDVLGQSFLVKGLFCC